MLSVCVRCEKQELDKIVARKTKRDVDVWKDEVVELFIDPLNSGLDLHFHIAINANGVTQDAKEKDVLSWDPELQVRCGREPGKAWIMEVRIPFRELGIRVGEVNKVWSANIIRSARRHDKPKYWEETSWAPTGLWKSHVPSMFGYLLMAAGTRDNTNAPGLQRTRQVLRLCVQYLPDHRKKHLLCERLGDDVLHLLVRYTGNDGCV